MRVNKFEGYKSRRIAALFFVAAIAWFPYAAYTYFIFPSWEAFFAAVFLTVGGCIPLTIFGIHYINIANAQFASARKAGK
jgi:hypothetical protein